MIVMKKWGRIGQLRHTTVTILKEGKNWNVLSGKKISFEIWIKSLNVLWNPTPLCRDEKRPSYCRRFQSAVTGLSLLFRHGSYTLVFDKAATNLPLTHKERSNDPCEYPKITCSATYLSASPPGRCQRAAGRQRDGKKESRSRQIKKKWREGQGGMDFHHYIIKAYLLISIQTPT